MAQNHHLGLFDTPPSRHEVRFSLVIVGLLVAALLIILPVHDVQLRQIPPFIPMIDSVMFFSELIIAALLYGQAAVFRSRALTVLATGFVFAALLLVPHALTFPGAFDQDGLLGAGVNSTAWIYTARRIALPIALILYVAIKSADDAAQRETNPPPEKIIVWILAAVVLSAAVTMLATSGHDVLPPFFRNSFDRDQTYAIGYQSVVLALYVVAAALLFRKRSSVLDMWLLVALSGWLVQALLNVPIQARFTLGWYSLFVMMLVSNLIVMLALIAETNWLYARLALSTSARKREREARMMSMDAVTAAISHEVGQPLAAVGLHVSVGLDSLSRPQPNIEKAISALRSASDAKQRTFDVIKSIRAMFARGAGPASKFCINDLVRETAAILGREVAGAKVSLRLGLHEALPPIRGDRVQIQRVLVNLITNAIESLAAKRGRPRRVEIRSAPLGDKGVLLEVSDTGAGIVLEDLEHIFDPFFTTKATGTGLGLSLCRTIVEEHGGRLWVSRGQEGGATFHLQLPHSDVPTE